MALGKVKLTSDDHKNIASEIFKLQKADEPVKAEAVSTEADVVTDPSLDAYYKAEAELVKQLGINGGNIVVYRGKYGCTRVNTTMEALDNVRRMIKDIRTGRTSQKF